METKSIMRMIALVGGVVAFCAAASLAGIARPRNPAEMPDVTFRWPVVTAPLMAAPPAIDGAVDRAEWTQAAMTAPLILFKEGVQAPESAVVYAGYTADALYLAFQFVRPPYALKPVSGDAPTGVWKDDCFEFFVRPDFGASYEYSFVGNAAGVFCQGRRQTVTDRAWKCDWTFKARLTDWGWEGEMAIPFKSLGREAPKSGEVWEFAPMSNRKTPGAQLATWSFIRGWMERKDFGYLVFDGPAPAVRVLKAGGISAAEIGAVIEIANFTDKTAEIAMRTDLYKPSKDGVEYFKTMDGAADLWGGATDAKSDVPPAKVAQDALKQYTVIANAVREVAVPPGQTRRISVVEAAPRGAYVLHYRVTDKGGRVLAGGALPFLKTDPLELVLTPYVLSAGVVEVVADHQRLASVAGGDMVRVSFLDAAGKAAAQGEAPLSVEKGRTTLNLSVKGLRPGPYVAQCQIAADKAIKAEVKAEFMLPAAPAWWGNDHGRPEAADTVPEPWTPMEITKTGFKVWGRNTDLGEALQPARLLNGGEEMLAGPAVLDLQAKDAAWAPAQVVREKKTGLAWRQSFKAAGLKGELLLEAEFDGFMKYTLSLSPADAGAARVERLALDIPLKADLVTHFRHGSFGTPASNALIKGQRDYGALPAGGLALPFTCTLWLGGERMGLEWCAESDQYWSLGKDDKAVTVTRDGGAARMRVNLVSQPMDIKTPVRYEWSLLATPTKPMNQELLRGLRYAQSAFSLNEAKTGLDTDQARPTAAALAQAGVNAFGQWCWAQTLWNEDFGAPGYRPSALNEIRAKAMAEAVRICQESGIKWFIIYAIWQTFSDWPDVGPLWKEQARHPLQPSLGGYLYCPARPFADWYIATLRQTIADTNVNGVYLDSSPAANLCCCLHHGCGYVDDKGELHGTYVIWANREFHKRIYTLFHGEMKKGGLVYAHHSSYPFMAVESFVDIHHCGEGSTLTRDAAIPKFYGYPFGLPVQFTRWNNPAYPETRMNSWRFVLQVDSLIKAHPGMVISKSVMPTYKGIAREGYLAKGYDRMGEAVWQVWQAQKSFPWDGAQWIPSWHVRPYADSGSEDVWVCMNLNPGKAALVAVSDLREKPEGDLKCALKLDWEKMGFDPERVTVKDVILGKAIPRTPRGLDLEIKEKLFRYLEIRPAP